MSNNETEIKLPVADPGRTLAGLERIGAKVKEARHFEDNLVFDTADRRIRSEGNLLRLRNTDRNTTLTFKGRSDTSRGVKEREEIETTASSAEGLRTILERLGFMVIFHYQKYRTIFEIEGVPLEFCVDETPIGNFLELEGPIEEIHRFAGLLGYSRSDYVTDSYGTLYDEWCQQQGRTPGNMVFV
jgi:adenylate cyclase class 2